MVFWYTEHNCYGDDHQTVREIELSILQDLHERTGVLSDDFFDNVSDGMHFELCDYFVLYVYPAESWDFHGIDIYHGDVEYICGNPDREYSITSLYDNGQIKYELSDDGTWRYYYESGQLQYERTDVFVDLSDSSAGIYGVAPYAPVVSVWYDNGQIAEQHYQFDYSLWSTQIGTFMECWTPDVYRAYWYDNGQIAKFDSVVVTQVDYSYTDYLGEEQVISYPDCQYGSYMWNKDGRRVHSEPNDEELYEILMKKLQQQ